MEIGLLFEYLELFGIEGLCLVVRRLLEEEEDALEGDKHTALLLEETEVLVGFLEVLQGLFGGGLEVEVDGLEGMPGALFLGRTDSRHPAESGGAEEGVE